MNYISETNIKFLKRNLFDIAYLDISQIYVTKEPFIILTPIKISPNQCSVTGSKMQA